MASSTEVYFPLLAVGYFASARPRRGSVMLGVWRLSRARVKAFLSAGSTNFGAVMVIVADDYE